MEGGWSASYVAINPSDKADGGAGGSNEYPQAFGTVVYGDNAYLVYELTRIANALERIAPYFEERIISNGLDK